MIAGGDVGSGDTALLAFGFVFFLAAGISILRKYAESRERDDLIMSLFAFAFSLMPLGVLLNNIKLTVLGLAALIVGSIYSVAQMLFGGEKSRAYRAMIRQMKDYDGKLSYRDLILTWKPIAYLDQRFGRFWASVLYSLFISLVSAALFTLLIATISKGEFEFSTFVAFGSFGSTMFFINFVRTYRALSMMSTARKRGHER